MNRYEFMKQLDQLLFDLPEDEREEALNFYSNYFDDAGVENEEQIIRELRSPEKVARTIKADLLANGENAKTGEYTEHGYYGADDFKDNLIKVEANPIRLEDDSKDYMGEKHANINQTQEDPFYLGQGNQQGYKQKQGYESEQNQGYQSNQNQGYQSNQNQGYQSSQNQGYQSSQNQGYQSSQNQGYQSNQNQGYQNNYYQQQNHNQGYQNYQNQGQDYKQNQPYSQNGESYEGPRYHNYASTRTKTNIPALILLCIFGFPFIFPMMIAGFCTLFGLVLGFGIAGVACSGLGIVLVVTGLTKLVVFPVGITVMGGGLICFGIGVLFIILTVLVAKGFPLLCRAVAAIFRAPFGGRRVAA